MTCEEARFMVQALFDKELEGDEADRVIDHIESCYRCRKEYTDLLRLESRMSGRAWPEPPREWFEDLARLKWRRRFSRVGLALFVVSYVLLMGYALFSLLTDGSESILYRVAVGGLSAGLITLFFVVAGDRLRERREEKDRYKGIMK